MATKTKKTATAKTETAEQKIEVNGSYDFLISHFAEPSSIIDAATALAGDSKMDPQIAVKKVEQFLENAKIDQTLEVRAGTGSNEGQYIIARVPQSAQRKNGGREVKKAEKSVGKTAKKVGVIASMVAFLKHEHTKEAVLAYLEKQFPHREVKGMSSTFNIQVGGTHPRLADKGLKVKSSKREDKVYYQIV